MRLAINHVTAYRFDPPLAHGLQRLRLGPKESHGQIVREWRMQLSGARIEASYEDHNGNHVNLVSVEPGTAELTIACTGVVDTADRAGVLGPHSGRLPLWAFLAQTPLTRPGPRMRALAAAAATGQTDRLGLLHALSAAVLEAVAYEIGHTDTFTSGEEALGAGKGVCQDHAHVFIGCARTLGVPARYVSGYLMTRPPPGQAKLKGADASHAWLSVWSPELGWVDFDPTNGIIPGGEHITVAFGRDYEDISPISGVLLGGGDQTMMVSVDVEPVS